MSNLNSIFKKFKKVKVLVIGDVMLDRYIWGTVDRISPEAPVPVVKLDKTSLVLGGAANVAANIAGLGSEVRLLGAIGADEEGKLFKPLLEDLGIDPDDLIKLKDRPTTVKTRIVAHNQHVVRIDQENKKSLTNGQEKSVLAKIEKMVEEADVIILSDYAKGFLSENVLLRLITISRGLNKLIVIDPKGKNYSKYANADILTPNRFEAAEACGLALDDNNVVENAGKFLLESLSLKAVLITQGENGMTLFRKNENPVHLQSMARKVYDVTGAGDTVIAAFSVAAASGCDLPMATSIANMSAGIVVEEVGTTTINLSKLEKFVSK